ncbi:uncharacterized protein LOC144422003 isoform X2 [Styela clava]
MNSRILSFNEESDILYIPGEAQEKTAEGELYDLVTEGSMPIYQMSDCGEDVQKNADKNNKVMKSRKTPNVYDSMTHEQALEKRIEDLLAEQYINKNSIKLLMRTAKNQIKVLRKMKQKIQNETELVPSLCPHFERLKSTAFLYQRNKNFIAIASVQDPPQLDHPPDGAIRVCSRKSMTVGAIKIRKRWRSELKLAVTLEAQIPKLAKENEVLKLRMRILQQNISTLVNEIKALHSKIELQSVWTIKSLNQSNNPEQDQQ